MKQYLQLRTTFAILTCVLAAMRFSSSYASLYHIDNAVSDKNSIVRAMKITNNSTYEFFSHGRPGELLINGEWKNAEKIAAFINHLPLTIKHLNIYGCEFAKGEKGLAAVAYLEKTLDVSISASTNITGKGGDWVLEAGNLANSISIQSYNGNLQYADGDDFDGDGIINSADIDDDNDGVLDATEKNVFPSLFTPKSSVAVTAEMTYSVSGLAGLVDDVDGTTFVVYNPNGTFAGTTWLKFEFPTAQSLTLIELGHYPNQTLFATSSTYDIQGSNDNTAWTTIVGGQTYTNTAPKYATNNSAKFSMPSNTTAYKYYRIQGIAGSSGAGWAQEAYFEVRNETDLDSDSDGISNRFDLDSDNDSVGDAFEAGASSDKSPTFKFSGSVGANGLDNSLETSDNGTITYSTTYNSYAIYKFLALGKDTDGDTVLDIVDIDDDNDGVLDATECPTCYYTSAEAARVASVTTALNIYSPPTYNISNAYDNNTATSSALDYNQAITGVTLYEITPTTPVAITSVNFDMFTWYMTTSDGGVSKVVLQGYNGTTWEDLDIPAAHSTVTSGLDVFTNSLHPNTVYSKFRIQGTAGSCYFSGVKEITLTLNNYIPSANPKATCSVDTDSDGTTNNLDLDSDEDGCSDAKEAGATTSTTANFQFSVLPGDDTNSNGLVDVKETGNTSAINYTSFYSFATNNTTNGCTDTDGDGVGDLMDIDDDNDGILDTDEVIQCPITAVSNILTTANDAYATFSVVGGDGNVSGMGYPYWIAGGSPPSEAVRYDFVNPVTKLVIGQTVDISGISTTSSELFEVYINGQFYPLTADMFTGFDPVNTYLINGAVGCKDYAAITNFTSLSINYPAGINNIQIRCNSNGTFGNGFQIANIEIKETFADGCTGPTYDSDGDGIPNRLDLDSDGDGCPDALEGDGAFTQSNLSSSSIPGGNTTLGFNGTYDYPVVLNLGTSSNPDGTPTAGTQGVGASQNGSDATACATLDQDGDGVTDQNELVDGTDPTDACEFEPTSITMNATSTGDCDGDGVTNAAEINGTDGDYSTTADNTDPNDGCSYNVGSITLTPSDAWKALDCDKDGRLNGTDPHVKVATATADVLTAPKGSASTVDVLTNDDFLPGANTTITHTGGTATGTVGFNATTGVMSYTPDPLEALTDVTVTYTVCNTVENPDVCTTATVTITVQADPLPVTLISFTGKATAEGNELKWTTANEKEFDKFIVEKATDVKKGFEAIGTVSGGDKNYTLTDRFASKGNNYYRLKMIDRATDRLDGTYAYSKIIPVYQPYGVDEHIVYPNPATGHAIYIKNYFEIQDYKLYDAKGSEVQIKLSNDKNQYQFRIDRSAKPGVYMLKYNVDGQWIVRKIVLID